MKTFKVYKHPARGFEAVKVGFSWPALFFGLIWMLVKRLWNFAAIWFGLYIVLAIAESVAKSPFSLFIIFVVYMALWLMPAFKGNEWREANLSTRGFEYLDKVEANNPREAVAQMPEDSAQNEPLSMHERSG